MTPRIDPSCEEQSIGEVKRSIRALGADSGGQYIARILAVWFTVARQGTMKAWLGAAPPARPRRTNARMPRKRETAEATRARPSCGVEGVAASPGAPSSGPPGDALCRGSLESV